MYSFLDSKNHDLVTPDGMITKLVSVNEKTADATVLIKDISPAFVGFEIDPENVLFNIKSTVAQVGLDATTLGFELNPKTHTAEIKIQLRAIGPLAVELLSFIEEGAYIGKLFAADERRRVRNPDYLSRMFGRSDRWGEPLLSLGGMYGSNDLILDKVDGRTIAYLTLQNGRITYDASIHGFLPTLAKALKTQARTRELLSLHQEWNASMPRNVSPDEILLARTLPLHIRTVFGHVVNSLLSQGFTHTSASILQPDTTASGDVYELFGDSKRELADIPLEFYTLEPYREYVFYSDRDQLQQIMDQEDIVFSAFEKAPEPVTNAASVFIVKGQQLLELKPDDWVVREQRQHEFPGVSQGNRQALMIERFIEQQSSYPFLKAIDDGKITSQGILLTRFFPSPLMKRMLLSDQVQRALKGIYFLYPSFSNPGYFSAEDRGLLHDLEKFAIPIYWVDESTATVLKYCQKRDRDSGMFVPLKLVDAFMKSTVFGIYGSNLLEGSFEKELIELMKGVLELRNETNHPFLSKNTPLALVTGGGPGAMEVGNRVASELNIISCANIVDFRPKDQEVVNEQKQNPYIEAKMTYRIDKLVERQAEFNLDFPIFLTGGIGTDFEYALEEVRRKVGTAKFTPILLFGTPEYWRQKNSFRFRCNLETGTIKGSEWISNCFYCVQTAKQGLKIYREYFTGVLPIGKQGPIYEDGFAIVPEVK
jgi:hypothetical protein